MGEYICSELLGEQYCRHVLSNGLTVLCYYMPQRTGVYAIYGAGIGSNNRDFSRDGKRVSVPAGIAHYLEHKLFEGEQGDAFSLFAKTGAAANAFTSFDRTCYLFSATDGIDESMRTLLRFVSEPHFTEENVEKERGIITQEIKMYDDDPDWQLMAGTLRLLYSAHPLRDDIAGTPQSIAKITPQLLYDCYDAYYRPENMVLAVAGNMSAEHLVQLCEQTLDMRAASRGEIKTIAAAEPPQIAAATGSRQMDISGPQFCLGYKAQPFTEDRLKNEVLCDLLCDLIVGETTDVYRELYDAGLINTSFYSECLSGADYLCFMFGGESEDPQRVADTLRRHIERLARDGVDPNRFEEARRSAFGDAVLEFDSTKDVAANLAISRLKGYCIYDVFGVLTQLKADDAHAMISRLFSTQRSALFTLLPRERN